MKLVDIKASIKNSVCAEFKHAFYNASGILGESIVELFNDCYDEVFREESASSAE